MQETLCLSVPEITPHLHTKHLLEVRVYIKAIIFALFSLKKNKVCIIVFNIMWDGGLAIQEQLSKSFLLLLAIHTPAFS